LPKKIRELPKDLGIAKPQKFSIPQLEEVFRNVS
jgi:hypothetical protein